MNEYMKRIAVNGNALNAWISATLYQSSSLSALTNSNLPRKREPQCMRHSVFAYETNCVLWRAPTMHTLLCCRVSIVPWFVLGNFQKFYVNCHNAHTIDCMRFHKNVQFRRLPHTHSHTLLVQWQRECRISWGTICKVKHMPVWNRYAKSCQTSNEWCTPDSILSSFAETHTHTHIH